MVKMTIHYWKLTTLSDENYDLLRQYDKQLPAKDENNSYSMEVYVQDVSSLPAEILNLASWESLKTLNMLFPGGTPSPKSIKEALAGYQVHLPGNDLLGIQSVDVRTNCCTEELQKALDMGWRIIAVCPQSGERRPDYVLGKFTRYGS